MKRQTIPSVLLVLAGVLCCQHADAQIGIQIEADREKYVRYEPVKLTVTLRNYTGNTLIFGLDRDTEGSLDFLVETPEGLPIRQLDRDANPVAGLVLGTGETKSLTLTLNNLYDMQSEGVYIVAAQVGHPRLQNDYRSNEHSLEVRTGLVLWEQMVGIPAAERSDRIQSRKITLMMFRDKKGEIYCLRSEDEGYVYGVVRLGPRIAGSEPQCDVDSVSNVHVLFLIRPRLYAYRVYDYNLELRQEKYYVLEDYPPRLDRDQDIGRITVVGGRTAVEGQDFRLDRNAGKPASAPVAEAAPGENSAPAETDKPDKTSGKDGLGSLFRGLFRFGRK